MSFLPSLDSLVQKMTSITSKSPKTSTDTPDDATRTTHALTPAEAGLDDDPAYDPSLTSPSAVQLSTSLTHTREISMIEKGTEHVGVVFSPKLAEQRIAWCLDVLRRENVRSVLDVGCGEGALLQILSRPASTIMEDPIVPVGSSSTGGAISPGNGQGGSSSRPSAGGLKRLRSETSEFAMNGRDAARRSSRHEDSPEPPGVFKELFIHVSRMYLGRHNTGALIILSTTTASRWSGCRSDDYPHRCP